MVRGLVDVRPTLLPPPSAENVGDSGLNTDPVAAAIALQGPSLSTRGEWAPHGEPGGLRGRRLKSAGAASTLPSGSISQYKGTVVTP